MTLTYLLPRPGACGTCATAPHAAWCPASPRPRVFDVDSPTVVAEAGCTYCGAAVGEPCEDRYWRADWGMYATVRRLARAPHSQRWYDRWNVRHPEDQRPVVRASWRR